MSSGTPPTGYTLPGYKGPYNPSPASNEASIVIYNYIPSLAFAGVALGLFAGALVGHGVLLVQGARGGTRRRKVDGPGAGSREKLDPTGASTARDSSTATATEATAPETGAGGATTTQDTAAATTTAGERMRVKQDSGGSSSKSLRTFEALVAFGCLMEIVGYAFRAYSHKHPFVVYGFVVQYFFIVVAPVLFSAALYLSLQYALRASPSNVAVLPRLIRRAFVPFFITVDVLTTIIQIAGAALIGTSESDRTRNGGRNSKITPEQANDILLAGLALQCASFLVFLSILALVIIRTRAARKRMAPASSKPVDTIAPDSAAAAPTYTSRFLAVLAASSLLVFLRTVFRLAETADGIFSYASSTEWLFGLLEFAPIIVAVYLWIIFPLRDELGRMMMGWVR